MEESVFDRRRAGRMRGRRKQEKKEAKKMRENPKKPNKSDGEEPVDFFAESPLDSTAAESSKQSRSLDPTDINLLLASLFSLSPRSFSLLSPVSLALLPKTPKESESRQQMRFIKMKGG